MIVTRLGHACILMESSSTRILIDPGTFSNTWHGLTDLDAILLTHQHPDHFDVDNVTAVIDANPGARLLVEPAVAEMLAEQSPHAALVGEKVDLGGVTVEVVGGAHA